MSIRAIRRGAATVAVGGVTLALIFSGAAASGKTSHAAAAGPAFTLSFQPSAANAESNMSVDLTDQQQQPTSVAVSLPAGMKLNTSAVPTCSSPPTCEPATQVGSGSATVVVNGYTIPLNIAIYNLPTGGLSLVIQNPKGSPIVKSASWSGTQLTIPYPQAVFTSGNCASTPGGCPIVVTQLSLEFNTEGVGKGNYITTPAACTSAGWSSKAAFTFTSGTTANIVATDKCGQYATKAKPKKKTKKKKKSKKKK